MSQCPLPPSDAPKHSQWLPFYILAGVLGVLTPAVMWGILSPVFWWTLVGIGIGILVGAVLAASILATGICYHLAEMLRAPARKRRAFLRALGLQGLSLLWLVTMAGASPHVKALGETLTRENGAAVVAAVEEFRSLHGRYPTSLGEAEDVLGRRLPRPVFEREFNYDSDGTTFSLSFSGGGPFDVWSFDSQTGRWECEDYLD